MAFKLIITFMKNRLISVALSALMFVPALASALQYGITATGVTYPIPSVPAPYTCKTNYYVAKSGSDSNNGTSASTPWLTVSHAAAALGTARNGVCVNVGPGTYTEHVALNGITAGSDTSTGYLVFRSTTLHGALLHESGLNNVVDIN